MIKVCSTDVRGEPLRNPLTTITRPDSNLLTVISASALITRLASKIELKGIKYVNNPIRWYRFHLSKLRN